MKALFSFLFCLICTSGYAQSSASDLPSQADPMHHTGGYLLLVSGVFILIIWLVRRWSIKKGASTRDTPSPGFRRFIKISVIVLFLIIAASQIYDFWYHPGQLVFMALLIGGVILFLLLVQYLRFPDWMYRNHDLYIFSLFWVLFFGFGLGGVLIFMPEVSSAGALTFTLPLAVVVLTIFIVISIFMRRKWDRLKQATPCPEETAHTISAKAELLNSIDEEAASDQEGRVLLFSDRLVFAGKDGSFTPIHFNSIQSVHIHHLSRLIPLGLELKDLSGKVRYLVVELPNYWKRKIIGQRAQLLAQES